MHKDPTGAMRQIGRRGWLGSVAAAGLVATRSRPVLAQSSPGLEVGHGTVDTTPPIGIELAGFHRAPGNERRITQIRQPTAARALVLRLGRQQAALVSVDICAVSATMAARTAAAVGRACGIDPQNVRICATHTHSMPCFQYLRQWGAVSPTYEVTVEKAVVLAVSQAQADLAPAELYVGRHRTVGANFNRTTRQWQTDANFTKGSDASQRWLDTTVHVLRWDRRGRPPILWYHFSAHPVCYTDGAAGPDWPGLVARLVQERFGVVPSLLQGHCGDVNPGDGQPWLGVPETVAQRVFDGLAKANDAAQRIGVKELRVKRQSIDLPLDLDRFTDQIARYEKNPSQCTTGEWVDAGFAKDWHTSAKRWPADRKALRAHLALIQLGEVAMIFHPAELYSVYGLTIRRDVSVPFTVVVGYADGIVGYLTDPAAYTAGEYAATTVPKILDLPPFRPDAAESLTAAAVRLV